MADLSRRGFLSTSVAAAAGVAGIGLAAGLPAAVEAADLGGDVAASNGVVAHVRDASTGEVAVFNGEQETVVRDRALANRLLRAAK
jgi:hypothetical protein